MGESDAAMDDLLTVIAEQKQDRATLWTWIWQMHTQQGDARAAAGALAQAGRTASLAHEKRLVRFLGGSMPVEDWLQEASTSAERAMAMYYAGAKLLVEDKSDEARMWLRRRLDAGHKESVEYDLALCHLGEDARADTPHGHDSAP
jgi:hypothetical protein